jgi:crotonyl-CoA carboxylase/reductase
MVVFCAGTTGYNLAFDARYVWMRQKRIQGSHFANSYQANQSNKLVLQAKIDTCLLKTFRWRETPDAHSQMWNNKLHGRTAVLVNSPKLGLKTLAEAAEMASR